MDRCVKGDMTNAGEQVAYILRQDKIRWYLLDVVRSIELPDCWVGAGFVRDAVWDYMHRHNPSPPAGDVDVIWYDLARADPELDRAYEATLKKIAPSVVWSVKNQARMHVRNADSRYGSSIDAMRYWPETATAIAARRHGVNECEIAAPFGFDDLFGLILRPTPRFVDEKRGIYVSRIASKGWLTRWPLLRNL